MMVWQPIISFDRALAVIDTSVRDLTSKLGKPDSIIVGKCAAVGERLAPVTASARKRPLDGCGDTALIWCFADHAYRRKILHDYP